jgi:hypothetical protein
MLVWLGTVSGNEWFHESSIEILQCVAWSTAQPGRSVSQLWPNKSQPEISSHSHPRSQPRGRTARMRLQKILDIVFNDVRELFDFQCDHIQVSRAGDVLDSRKRNRQVNEP